MSEFQHLLSTTTNPTGKPEHHPIQTKDFSINSHQVIQLRPKQAIKLMKQILEYREHCQQLPELEDRMIQYLKVSNRKYLAGHELTYTQTPAGYELQIREMDQPEMEQLKLELGIEDEKEELGLGF